MKRTTPTQISSSNASSPNDYMKGIVAGSLIGFLVCLVITTVGMVIYSPDKPSKELSVAAAELQLLKAKQNEKIINTAYQKVLGKFQRSTQKGFSSMAFEAKNILPDRPQAYTWLYICDKVRDKFNKDGFRAHCYSKSSPPTLEVSLP